MKSGGLLRETAGWETLSEETHYSSDHLSVATCEVRTPTRPAGRRWTVVHRKAAVVVAAITADGLLVLIRQERVPIRSAIWEVPAGQIDEPAENTPEVAAQVALGELREETGYELAPGGELLSLGHFFSSPGFTDEHGYFFLARPVQKSAAGHAHQESESILDCDTFGPDQLREMIGNNEIRDGNTLSICAKLVARGLLSFSR